MASVVPACGPPQRLPEGPACGPPRRLPRRPRAKQLSIPKLLRPVIPDDDELSAAQSPMQDQHRKKKRITLSAMTGALGEIAQDAFSAGRPSGTPLTNRSVEGSGFGFGLFQDPNTSMASSLPGGITPQAGRCGFGIEKQLGPTFGKRQEPSSVSMASGWFGQQQSPPPPPVGASSSGKQLGFGFGTPQEKSSPSMVSGSPQVDRFGVSSTGKQLGIGFGMPQDSLIARMASRSTVPQHVGGAGLSAFGGMAATPKTPKSEMVATPKSVPEQSEMDWEPVQLGIAQCFLRRDSGQAKRNSLGQVKCRRDSIGPDAGPEVMAVRAARKFFKATLRKKSNCNSDSSSTDEDKPDRHRQQRAFECGVRTAEGQAGVSSGWAANVQDGIALSPRSFARGAKAAECAAKAAAEIQQRRSARRSERLTETPQVSARGAQVSARRQRRTNCSTRSVTPVGTPAPSPFASPSPSGTPKKHVIFASPSKHGGA